MKNNKNNKIKKVSNVNLSSAVASLKEELLACSSYRYLKDLSLPDVKWVADNVKPGYIKVGPIGDTTEYDYSIKSLLAIGEFNRNIEKLQTIFDGFNNINSYAICFLVRNSINNVVTSLDKHFLVNKTTDIKGLLQEVYKRIDSKSSKYGFTPDDNISVRIRALHFKVKDPSYKGGKIMGTYNFPITNKIKGFNLKYKLLSSNYIPHTMDLNFYGMLLYKKDNVFLFEHGKVLLRVEVIDKEYHNLQIFYKDSLQLLGNVEDLYFDNTLIRQFILDGEDMFVQYDLNHKLVNTEYNVKSTFMTKGKKDLVQDTNILAFDIECYSDNENGFIPYACAFYDGEKAYTYYVLDFENFEAMLYKCINDMLVPKYHNYTVYCHNFGRFDCIFLHKIYHKYFKVSNIISKELDIISVTLKSKTVKGKIKPRLVIRDSIRILPSSLRSLGISFEVETRKGDFPYSYVNANNLNYKGDMPDIKYYNRGGTCREEGYETMTTENYNNLKANTKVWSMRDETMLYLEKDIICTFQVVSKMSDIIFKKYRINITDQVTVSGLAIAIYRSNFLKPEYKLAHTTGGIEYAIRSAYFGGRCEILTPIGDNLVSYDYNSLYPSAMLQAMPVGQPIYSLRKDLSKIFGFVKATVTTPAINVPILPCKIYIDGDERLIFPIGKWTGWYFSEELKLAEQYGYKIEVDESYIFEKGYGYFDEYIKEMAYIKDNSTGAMREIHKLLLNTLYGRLGMTEWDDCIKTVCSSKAEEIHLTHNVICNFRVCDNKEYIRYHKTPDPQLCEQSGVDFEEELLAAIESKSPLNTSSAIAAATASWARILMYPHIINCLYTDTDSVFIKKPLNDKVVGRGLGKFKAEHGLISKAIFISPKLYFLEKQDGSIVSKRKGFSGKLSKAEYLELYNGDSIEVMDVRWRRNLEIGAVNISHQKINISSKFYKRNKIYSLGKWVATSPICINSSLQILTTALTLTISQEGLIIPFPRSLSLEVIKPLKSAMRCLPAPQLTLTVTVGGGTISHSVNVQAPSYLLQSNLLNEIRRYLYYQIVNTYHILDLYLTLLMYKHIVRIYMCVNLAINLLSITTYNNVAILFEDMLIISNEDWSFSKDVNSIEADSFELSNINVDFDHADYNEVLPNHDKSLVSTGNPKHTSFKHNLVPRMLNFGTNSDLTYAPSYFQKSNMITYVDLGFIGNSPTKTESTLRYMTDDLERLERYGLRIREIVTDSKDNYPTSVRSTTPELMCPDKLSERSYKSVQTQTGSIDMKSTMTSVSTQTVDKNISRPLAINTNCSLPELYRTDSGTSVSHVPPLTALTSYNINSADLNNIGFGNIPPSPLRSFIEEVVNSPVTINNLEESLQSNSSLNSELIGKIEGKDKEILSLNEDINLLEDTLNKVNSELASTIKIKNETELALNVNINRLNQLDKILISDDHKIYILNEQLYNSTVKVKELDSKVYDLEEDRSILHNKLESSKSEKLILLDELNRSKTIISKLKVELSDEKSKVEEYLKWHDETENKLAESEKIVKLLRDLLNNSNK